MQFKPTLFNVYYLLFENSAINLSKFPLHKIESIQNNGVSKVLGLVDSKYSITNSNNTTNVTGSIGAELKLNRLNADKIIDASKFDLANSVVYDIYPRYIEETINIKQKDNLCLMLKKKKQWSRFYDSLLEIT